MSYDCIVPKCTSNQFTKTLFRFPINDPLLLSKWIEKINFSGICRENLQYSFLCEDHFEFDEKIIGFGGIITLVPNAVPTIFDFDEDVIDVQQTCRFCLKNNSNDQVLIDCNIKKNFQVLMDKELKEGISLPNTSCKSCVNDIKKSATIKNKIIQNQTKLFSLVQNELKVEVDEEDYKLDDEDCLEPKSEPQDFASEDLLNFKQEYGSDHDNLFEDLDDTSSIKRKKKKRGKSNQLTSLNCEVCNKVLSCAKSLKRHKLRYHPTTLEDQETVEQKEKSYSERLPKDNCEDCGLPIWKRALLKHKVKVHGYPSSKVYECDFCGIRQPLKSDMVMHMRKKHIKQEKVPCQICGKLLSNERAIKSHVKFVHERKVQNICELCGLDFPSKNSYLNHMRIKHTGEKPFKCLDCDKAFSSAAVLQGHRIYLHTKEVQTCSICSKTFNNIRSLQSHQRLIHQEKKYICDFNNCGFKCATKDKLRDHQIAHSNIRKWHCKLCGSAYKKRHGLNLHIRTIHLNFVVKCEIPGCTAKYARKDFLRGHIRTQHKHLSEADIQILFQRIKDIRLPSLQSYIDQTEQLPD